MEFISVSVACFDRYRLILLILRICMCEDWHVLVMCHDCVMSRVTHQILMDSLGLMTDSPIHNDGVVSWLVCAVKIMKSVFLIKAFRVIYLHTSAMQSSNCVIAAWIYRLLSSQWVYAVCHRRSYDMRCCAFQLFFSLAQCTWYKFLL